MLVTKKYLYKIEKTVFNIRHKKMPTCRICGHVYNDENKWRFLQSEIYWCPFCSSVYKLFNPVPPLWFTPERNAEYVFEK